MSGLRFGTAGLRAPVGPGPDLLNVPTVTRATAGVAAWMKESMKPTRSDGRFHVAVGYDARYGSHPFARATAETFSGAGFEVTLIAEPGATPILAWLVKARKFDAGVQITASHNPGADNGYKLYLDGGRQLLSPADAQIEEAISRQPTADEIPRSEAKSMDLAAQNGYVTAISSVVATGEQSELCKRRTLKILYTPMHGVGGEALESALRSNGFGDIHFVPSQRWPDPDFPTVAFPNPEEPGATDLLLEQARELQPDLLIALDPDADRCMLGVPDPSEPTYGYRMLRGDETGPLLAGHVVSRRVVALDGNKQPPAPVVATTVVSSQLLGHMARRNGWNYVETLTGFKHLARAADDQPGELAFAYEEAIGTCPAPQVVADKDGIATALIAAQWVADLKEQGRTLLDELDELEQTYGVFRTGQVSMRFETPEQAAEMVTAVLNAPPAELAGITVGSSPIEDSAGRTTDGVELAGQREEMAIRVIARPSGTEPKAKFYLEVTGPAGSRDAVEDVYGELERAVKELF